MKCPKCHSELFKNPWLEGGKTTYFCIHCGMEGTYPEMLRKIPYIEKIINESLPQFHCNRCRRLFRSNQLKIIDDRYICRECEIVNYFSMK